MFDHVLVTALPPNDLRCKCCLTKSFWHAYTRPTLWCSSLQEHLNELTGNKAGGGLSGQQMAMYGEAVANLAK